MKGSNVPTVSILVMAAMAAFISNVAHATFDRWVGLPGSICAATKTDATKLYVATNGAVYNKRTDGVLNINCPISNESYYGTYVQLSYVKRDTQTLSCTLHKRVWDNVSGTAVTASTTSIGNDYLFFDRAPPMSEHNSIQCTIPKSAGTSVGQMNGINGVLYYVVPN